MKKYVLVITSFLLVLGLSCKEDKKVEKAQEMSQMNQVMAMHDEVMPKMSKINKLATDLRKRIDGDERGTVEKKAMEDLQAANESMMDWMQEFMGHFTLDEINKGAPLSKEKQLLLDADEQKMIDVKNKMEISIKNAQALLESE